MIVCVCLRISSKPFLEALGVIMEGQRGNVLSH